MAPILDLLFAVLLLHVVAASILGLSIIHVQQTGTGQKASYDPLVKVDNLCRCTIPTPC